MSQFVIPASEYPDQFENVRWYAQSCLANQVIAGPYERDAVVDGIRFRSETIASSNDNSVEFVRVSAGITAGGSALTVGAPIGFNAIAATSAMAGSTFPVSVIASAAADGKPANLLPAGSVIVMRLSGTTGQLLRTSTNVRLRTRTG